MGASPIAIGDYSKRPAEGENDTRKSQTAGDRSIPKDVEEVFRSLFTCEFSTIARDGTPITWPVSALWRPDVGGFLLTAAVGLSQKAFNIRRNPRVALLFSDPTGSRLSDPPTVLVQGEASAPDQIMVTEGLEDYWRMIYYRQRLPYLLSIANPLLRRGSDWYFMRIPISVAPKRILWWRKGQLESAPEEMEALHVS